MKKFILSLIGVIAIFLAVVGSSIYLTDYNKIYKDFVSSAKIDVKDINQVNYRIKQFPSPSLIIDEVKQEGKIELKNINIRFSLLSVLSFSHKVSDIEIGQAIIHLSNDDVNYIDHDEFIGELIKKEALTMSARIDKLIFVESDKDIPFTIENFVFSLDELQQEDVEQQLAVAELSDERENLGLTISSSLSKILLKVVPGCPWAISEFRVPRNRSIFALNQGDFRAE